MIRRAGMVLEADDYKTTATKVTSDDPTEETNARRREGGLGIASVGEGREVCDNEAREEDKNVSMKVPAGSLIRL